MASYEQITYEVDSHVAVVTLNRPAKLNAWTMQMADEVRAAMKLASADEQVRVIVFTGAGRGFCAGGDMTLLDSIKDSKGAVRPPVLDSFPASQEPDFYGPDSYFPAIDKPIICAVNGVAAGIGMVYPLYCDIRFASSSAYFFTAFAQRGAIAEHGMSWLLPRLVGLGNTFDLLYSARRIEADEALRMGLVNRVFAPDALMNETLAYARHLAGQMSPRSLRVMKRQVWTDLMRDLGEAVAISRSEMDLSFHSDDFREGIAHFLERRSPSFPGR